MLYCPSPALSFVPVVTMADIVLLSLPCDDDAPDMFDVADAESISDGHAAGLLDNGEDACSVCFVPRHRWAGFMSWNFFGGGVTREGET